MPRAQNRSWIVPKSTEQYSSQCKRRCIYSLCYGVTAPHGVEVPTLPQETRQGWGTQFQSSVSVAEADADGAGNADLLTVRVHGFQQANGLCDLHCLNAGVAQADHLAEAALGDKIHGRHAKARA